MHADYKWDVMKSVGKVMRRFMLDEDPDNLKVSQFSFALWPPD